MKKLAIFFTWIMSAGSVFSGPCASKDAAGDSRKKYGVPSRGTRDNVSSTGDEMRRLGMRVFK